MDNYTSSICIAVVNDFVVERMWSLFALTEILSQLHRQRERDPQLLHSCLTFTVFEFAVYILLIYTEVRKWKREYDVRSG